MTQRKPRELVVALRDIDDASSNRQDLTEDEKKNREKLTNCRHDGAEDGAKKD
jgi:hypothetical protein